MRLSIKISSKNSAFSPIEDGRSEIARILRSIAEKVENGSGRYEGGTILDINGNSVGDFHLT